MPSLKRKSTDSASDDIKPRKKQTETIEQKQRHTLLAKKRRAALYKRSKAEIGLVQQEKYPNGLKQCTVCREHKELHLFSDSKNALCGLLYLCRECDYLDKSHKKQKLAMRDQNVIDQKFNVLHPTGLKFCPKCKKDKLPEAFHNSKRQSDGKCSDCKECARVKRRKLTSEIRNIKAEAKLDKKCENCSCRDSRVFEFAHKLRSTKKSEVSHLYTIANVTHEITKTKILCANCHRKETTDENKILKKPPDMLSQTVVAIRARKLARRKFDLITKLKIQRVCCKDCGLKVDPKYPAIHDFDHLPGFIKIKKVSRMYNMSDENIIAESEKCQLLCANCHRITTINRKLANGKETSVTATNSVIV